MKRITKKIRVYVTRIACYDPEKECFFTVEENFFANPTKGKVIAYLKQNGYDVNVVDIRYDVNDITVGMDVDQFVKFGDLIDGKPLEMYENDVKGVAINE